MKVRGRHNCVEECFPSAFDTPTSLVHAGSWQSTTGWSRADWITVTPAKIKRTRLTSQEVGRAIGAPAQQITSVACEEDSDCWTVLSSAGMVPDATAATRNGMALYTIEIARMTLDSEARYQLTLAGKSAIVRSRTTFVMWTPESPTAGVARLWRVRGPWVMNSECRAATPEAGRQCAQQMERAQFRKLSAAGLRNPRPIS